MIIQLARIVMMTAGALGGFAATQHVDWTEQTGFSAGFAILIFIILGASIGYLFGGILGREFTAAFRQFERRLADMETPELALAAVGLLIGLFVAFLISSPLLRYLENPRWVGLLATILIYGFGAYGGVSLFMMRRRDVVDRWHRSTSKTATLAESPTLLDTSAVIDARFADIVRAGFLCGPLRVPRFVLGELQTLADSADDLRRARGRRGLDLLATMASGSDAVEVYEADYPETPEVDAKLVRLALATGGSIVTVDHNLTQVARVEGISVLNVNELAQAIRPVYLPGDPLRIAIVKEGKEAGQGVGYLEDGTMVVVQDGKAHQGSEVETEVTSVLSTSAGRMIFARPKERS